MATLLNTLNRPADNKPARGVIFYEGPSEIDGAPIVGIAIFKSSNRKTGNMVQTYIIRQDIKPAEASRLGLDASICGNCIHRGQHDDEGKLISGTRTCYVVLGQGPTGAFKSYQEDKYSREYVPGMFAGRFVRLGTYGDPAAIPFDVWAGLLEGTTGHNGYTHQWRECDSRFASLCMASADTEVDREHAKALGYRTFRTRSDAVSKLKGEFVCPASEEAGKKLTCVQCKACGGTSSKAKADVAITIHGGSAVTANAKRRGLLAA